MSDPIKSMQHEWPYEISMNMACFYNEKLQKGLEIKTQTIYALMS